MIFSPVHFFSGHTLCICARVSLPIRQHILSFCPVFDHFTKSLQFSDVRIFLEKMFSYKSYFMGAYQVLPATEKDAGADQAKIQGKRGFRCKFCGEKFKHSADLKLHQINHQKEEYPYSCKRCKKSFSRLSGISLHDCKKAQCIYQDSKLLDTNGLF